MSDPLSLLPFALAAGNGAIDGVPAQQAVAAGVTLLQRCAPLVRALAGRRAAILLPPGHAFLTALAAAEGRGTVLLNPLAAGPELAHQLADSDVGAVFTLAALAPRLPDGPLVVLLDSAPREAWVGAGEALRTVDLGSHVAFRLEGEQDVRGREEEAVIVYTSAMAGTPLGAILTHRNLLHNARATLDAAALTSDDRLLALLPWAHLFGLVVTGIAPLLAGAQVVSHDRFAPTQVLRAIEEEGVTVLVGVPSIFEALLAALDQRGGARLGGALRLCICGGAPLSPALQERWAHATGVELRQGYGLTEAGPVCLFNHASEPNARGSLGTPMKGVQVAIADPRTGEPCADGEEGELCVRGPNVSPGYVSGDGEGLQRRGGWLRTGDLGVRRADGHFAFRGALKPMFTRNGFNIYPREIERAVMELDGVREARVTAIPVPVRENDIRLAVVGRATEEELRQWCRDRLSAYKQPTVVEITSS